jgi:hypothetical protein
MTKPPSHLTLIGDVQFTLEQRAERTEQRIEKIEQRLEVMTTALAAITRVLETMMTGKKVHEDAERSG